MLVLGIWDGHDAGAALVDTAAARILCAVNEERFSRRKLEVTFPYRSVDACLSEAGISPAEVSEIGVSTFDVAKTLSRLVPGMKERYYRLRRRLEAPGHTASFQKSTKYVLTQWGPNALCRGLSRWALHRNLARVGLHDVPLRLVPHHLAHAAAAAYTSGWDPALVLTLDGIGDGLSGSFWRMADGRLHRVSSISGRHSLGIFFEHVTNLLNMRELEDEGKVMALAAHAYPPTDGENPLGGLFQVEGLGLRCALGSLSLRRYLARELWRMPSEQFAWAAQAILERIAPELVANALRRTGLRRLAYAGGVASNIKVNLRLREIPELEDLFVFPHMGDGGLALGAALWVAATRDAPRHFDLGDLRLGPHVGEDAISRALDGSGLSVHRPPSLEADVAERLARGEAVLWFQGRMEYGPRALGGRSLLTRPDRPELRDRLNLRVKRRVWYQPFCPSMLDEEADRLLEDVRGRMDRYMTTAYRVNDEGRRRLAAVIGPDGTCRPQMVGPDGGRFRRLLEEIRRRIGVGAVLNTSFNLHGEPIVAGPEDALRTFLASGADAMAMEGFLVLRPEDSSK